MCLSTFVMVRFANAINFAMNDGGASTCTRVFSSLFSSPAQTARLQAGVLSEKASLGVRGLFPYGHKLSRKIHRGKTGKARQAAELYDYARAKILFVPQK